MESSSCINMCCSNNSIYSKGKRMIPDIAIAAWSIALFVIAYIITKKKIDNEK